jgi:hypothetical protein
VATVGIILFLAVAALSTDIVLENSGHTDVVIVGQTLSFDIWGLFALGAAAGVLLIASLQLMAYGLARTGQRRKQLRRFARYARPGMLPPARGALPPAPGALPPAPGALPPAPGAPAPAPGAPAPTPEAAPAPPPPSAPPLTAPTVPTRPKTVPTRPKGGPHDRVVARVADRGQRGDSADVAP